MNSGIKNIVFDKNGVCNYCTEFSTRYHNQFGVDDEVKKARLEELRQVRMHKVYTKVPIQQCWDEAGKNPSTVRWLDVNKGNEENKEYRSRLLAQEIKR